MKVWRPSLSETLWEEPPPDHTDAGGAGLGGWAAALCAALAVLLLYLRTLAPTVTGEDGGELMAAAWCFGIPHPTGYPLWTMLAGAMMHILPFGEPAWRASLLSAVLGAGTVLLACMLMLRLAGNPRSLAPRLAAAFTAFSIGASREYWEQSVIAEVYTLNAFLLALCFWLLFRWRDTHRIRPLALFGFTYGLSLCNHSTMACLGPLFAVFILWRMRGQYSHRRTWRALGVVFIAFMAGLLPWLYLPLRSMANPPMDWGNPETLRGFVDVFTRAQYQFIVLASPRTMERMAGQIWAFLGAATWEFTPWMVWLPIFGMIAPLPGNRWETRLLKACLLLLLPVVTIIPNSPLDHRGQWINSPYGIPIFLILAVFSGAMLASLAKGSPSLARRLIIISIAFAAALSPAFLHFNHNNQSRYWFARDYGLSLMETMDKDALFYGSGDHALFPMVYLQIVEGRRPDILIANKYGYLTPEAMALDPEHVWRPGMRPLPGEAEPGALFRIARQTSRPLYSVVPMPGAKAAGFQVEDAGLLYRYRPSGEAPRLAAPLPLGNWHTLSPAATHGDWCAELVLFEIYLAKAREEARGDEPARSLAYIHIAALLARGDKDGLNNIACVCAAQGMWDAALHYLEKAIEGDPDYTSGLVNLARVHLRQGRPEEALTPAMRAASLEDTPGIREVLRRARTALYRRELEALAD